MIAQYICGVNVLLKNPVFYSLLGADAPLGHSAGNVRWFDQDVSPFAGFAGDNANGFNELHHLLPTGRSILYATPQVVTPPDGWQVLASVAGLQFLLEASTLQADPAFRPTPLGPEHVPQMMALASLTKPGPFGPRTIAFGHYHGVFEGDQLVAMTGQRLHVNQFTEISAVCTHPTQLGKGYATALVRHQAALILNQNKIPFLHVRADNQRAIAVYQRLGFKIQGPMNFYFLRRV